MQVEQLVSLNQVSGDPPSVGHLLCLRRMGIAWSGNASPHVEAQNASEKIRFSQPVF